MRIVLVLVIAGALAFGALQLLGSDTDQDGEYDIAGDSTLPEEHTGGPMLRADEAGRAREQARRAREQAEAERKAREAAQASGKTRIWLTGRVVSAATSEPIPRARLAYEPSRNPCPRLPGGAHPGRVRYESIINPDGTTGANVMPGDYRIPEKEQLAQADAQGVFRVEVPADWHSKHPVDLLASAPGYITGFHCKIAPDHDPKDEIVIRLASAQQVAGRVVDPLGRPVSQAIVYAMPAEHATAVPGNSAYATTDEEGLFRLEPLSGKGGVRLRIDHDDFMPKELWHGSREDPKASYGDRLAQDIVLTPAYRVRFGMRTADGGKIVNPSISWKTDGSPPMSGVDLLSGSHDGPAAAQESQYQSTEVRIPASHRAVTIEIKADGYRAWRTENEPIPADGGEHTFDVLLERDQNVGRLALSFVNDQGETVSYASLGAGPPRIAWLGQGAPGGALVMEPGESLVFPALPAGPWRIGLTMPGHAPVSVDATIAGGDKQERTIKLTAPARVRVRFTAREALQVRFRILQDGKAVQAWIAAEGGARPASEESELSGQASAEGWVEITGLAEGSYDLEVTSAELRPARRSISASINDPPEYEIEVSRR